LRISTKITALLLAFFLMFSNIGLALDVHFCGDNIVASELIFLQEVTDFCTHQDTEYQNHSEENCTSENSCCGQSDDHSDCCKDQYITQESSDVVIVKSISVDIFVVAKTIYFLEFVNFPKNNNSEISVDKDYKFQKIPLYKRYCSLIFYA